ncbi:TIGR02444 family protein [Shewanella sp. GXUN23E]|uniref:TIGR02444 family protein n=1 Tax=Shewanella sp. GXUN23E TaxID=3422498 RepID=UPI003D7DC901
MTPLDQRLWQQCDLHYAKHRELCLSLQNQHQVNVNLLLLAWYLDGRRLGLDSSQWQEVTQLINRWEGRLLVPYRRLRQLGKARLPTAEYHKMLDVELSLERKGQNLILKWLGRQSLTPHHSNLEHFLQQYDLDLLAVADFQHQEDAVA